MNPKEIRGLINQIHKNYPEKDIDLEFSKKEFKLKVYRSSFFGKADFSKIGILILKQLSKISPKARK